MRDLLKRNGFIDKKGVYLPTLKQFVDSTGYMTGNQHSNCIREYSKLLGYRVCTVKPPEGFDIYCAKDVQPHVTKSIEKIIGMGINYRLYLMKKAEK